MATKNGKKDHRYNVVKLILESGKMIKTFSDIFKFIPKSTVAKSMHMNNNRMQSLIDSPGDFTFNEIKEIADLFGCEYTLLRDLVEKSQWSVTEKKPVVKKKSNG